MTAGVFADRALQASEGRPRKIDYNVINFRRQASDSASQALTVYGGAKFVETKWSGFNPNEVVVLTGDAVEVLYGTHRLSCSETVVMCLSCVSDERVFAKPIFAEGPPAAVMRAVMEHLEYPGPREAVATLTALTADLRKTVPALLDNPTQ